MLPNDNTGDTGAPQYVRTVRLAELTGLSRSYWNKRRVYGDGPPFIRLGGAVLYELRTVRAWLAKRQRASTSEHDHAA
jgi:hypothetical protein